MLYWISSSASFRISRTLTRNTEEMLGVFERRVVRRSFRPLERIMASRIRINQELKVLYNEPKHHRLHQPTTQRLRWVNDARVTWRRDRWWEQKKGETENSGTEASNWKAAVRDRDCWTKQAERGQGRAWAVAQWKKKLLLRAVARHRTCEYICRLTKYNHKNQRIWIYNLPTWKATLLLLQAKKSFRGHKRNCSFFSLQYDNICKTS